MCRKCLIEKSLIDFSKDKRRYDGLNYWCKPCQSHYDKNYKRKYEWYNTVKGAQYIANHKDRFKDRTPKWLTSNHWQEMAGLYWQAKSLSDETGIMHHVDHIVPLRGKSVSGLHVPWNLQILTAAENYRKSNTLCVA